MNTYQAFGFSLHGRFSVLILVKSTDVDVYHLTYFFGGLDDFLAVNKLCTDFLLSFA